MTPRPGWADRAILASGPHRCHVALGRIAARDSAPVLFFFFSFIKLAISGKIGYGFENAYKMKYSSEKCNINFG
jgi:hypothetical protein